MNSNLIPIDLSNANALAVPEYLRGNEASDDLSGHALPSFPSLSIKGKVFSLVQGDQRAVIPNPNDHTAPASRIGVIIIKAAKNNSKAYYDKPFVEGEDTSPACFSMDGVVPDPQSERPQCKTCAACKWNQFGTAQGPNGTVAKGKACADSARMVVAFPQNIGTTLLLRVPAASLKNLADYGRKLKRHGIPYQGVVTTIGMDPMVATPRLTFNYEAFLNKEMYDAVVAESKSEMTELMLGGMEGHAVGVTEEKAAAIVQQESTGDAAKHKAADEIIEQTVAQPAPQPAPAPQPVVQQVVEPVAQPAPQPAAEAAPKTADDLLAKFTGGLSFDD